MKEQYLGDAKDAFKWDYLDFLAKEMGSDLYIVPMLTPNDRTRQGESLPREFPASGDIWKFCDYLRERKKLEQLHELPTYTNGNYVVHLHKHKPNEFCHSKRDSYFNNMPSGEKHILFLDPDIGFEPREACEKHVKYSDIKTIWRQTSKDAIVVIFQHAWRNNHCTFSNHYKTIDEKLKFHIPLVCSTALFWPNKVMLVAIGKSPAQIEKVREANGKYQRKIKPIRIIDECGEVHSNA